MRTHLSSIHGIVENVQNHFMVTTDPVHEEEDLSDDEKDRHILYQKTFIKQLQIEFNALKKENSQMKSRLIMKNRTSSGKFAASLICRELANKKIF